MNRRDWDHPPRFVDADADMGDAAVAEAYYRELNDRPLHTADALNRWLLDGSELESCLDEEGSTRYVEMTCHTNDAGRERRYLDFIEQIVPLAKTWSNKLDRKLLDCPHRSSLPADRFGVLLRRIENRVRLFREENVALQTEDDRLRQQYQKLTGGLTVSYRGGERTMQQMAQYLEEDDRAVREETWGLVKDKWAEVRDDIETLYDRMVRTRHRMAHNAALPDYRDYAFRHLERFDYTPADCIAFAGAIERRIVPAAKSLADERRTRLAVETLRPWDLAVDPEGRSPLRPFATAAELVAGCGRIFARVDAELAGQFEHMMAAGLLDLESRKGKAPGGYMMDYKGRRLPFIFMNAVGTQRDVETLLHEGGHAFHVFAARDEPIAALRDAPIEFAEVASMGMELLSAPYLEAFYEPADAERARRRQLRDIVNFFPFMATIDQLQHWVYTHPTHGREERKQAWLELNRRFVPWIDYRGHADALAYAWHRKGHPFTVPFYYVEYGIAQLGALGVWVGSQRDRMAAVAAYRRALALGGSRPLPELFAAAGLRFDFSESTVEPAIGAIEMALRDGSELR
jgi:oligoendopeptidase F